jgi:hypothetical protein
MLGRGDTGAVLGSGAVDTEFWALVCEDEEWLRAEFEAIVSEPAEIPARPGRRPVVISAHSDWLGGQHGIPGAVRRPRFGIPPGRGWQRERSPPAVARRTFG